MSSFVLTLFCLFIGFFSSQGRNTPEQDLLSKDDLKEYSSDGSEIQEFDIISPQYTTSNGVSKRSTESTDSQQYIIREVQYEAFNTIYSLRLEKNDWLVRKGLQIEIIKSDGTIERRPPHTRDCHYFGSLAQHENSVAALSLCNGMYGLVSHNGSDYIIQPLKDHHASKVRRRRGDELPHIIYKRSVSKPSGNSDEPVERRHQPVCLHEAADSYAPTVPQTRELRSAPDPLSHVGPKYLEVLVVADKSMIDFHGNNTEQYVFTLMNIVSRMYADPSLGVTLRIHVVKFVLLGTDSIPMQGTSFKITGSPRDALHFCTWQATINPINDAHPEHWDNAILITRKDLYGVFFNIRYNSVSGRAFPSGTCTRESKCSVNQEDGWVTSLVIAHETGHTLGLNHDGEDGCVDGVHIMSASYDDRFPAFTWSECSRRELLMFLREADCLDDAPSNSPLSVHGLTGSTIDLNKQCEFALGPGSRFCITSYVNCEFLTCRRQSEWICHRFLSGLMDGTSCGEGKWCLSGSCVPVEALPNPINGGWSEWEQEHGECSRTCGGGVRMRVRYCNNPTPAFGGRSCEGSATGYYETCNLKPCATSDLDFRREQCSQTNGIPHSGKYYIWTTLPRFGGYGDDSCIKKCFSSRNFVAKRPPYQFVDGTRCWHGDYTDHTLWHRCVLGKCETFGCDGVHGSGSVLNACQQCNGNGSTCAHISGNFDGGKYKEHTAFLYLPVGATTIIIMNRNPARSHMGVESNGTIIFRGIRKHESVARSYRVRGSVIYYNYRYNREKIVIYGPLTVPLTVNVYLSEDVTGFLGVLYRPKIHYTSFFPRQQPTHKWIASQYGECSVSCGEGVQTRELKCTHIIENGRMEEVNETKCDQQSRPPRDTPCDRGACPATAQWVKTSWSECNVECGEGEQTRQVECQRGDVLAPGECSGDRPRDRRRCNAGECRDLNWSAGGWSECSVDCGFGLKYRSVTCHREGVAVDSSGCVGMPKPRTKSTCQRPPCNVPARWSAGPWSLCSATCGEGTETRNVSCERSGDEVTPMNCDGDLKPTKQRTCTLDPCPVPPEWVVGDWTECDSLCGLGLQIRSVTCQRNGQRSNGGCSSQERPSKEQPCESGPCPEINPENDSCNQVLTASFGIYLQSHPTGDSGCTTTLATEYGKSFKVTIDSVINCSNGEYLKIKEGTKKKKVCGNRSNKVSIFTDNIITIVHKTVSEDSGYRLVFERIKGSTSNRCDHLFLEPNGTIKSPGHPGTYPSNVDCRYRILTTPGRHINITFSSLLMQGRYPSCRYDMLEIIDIFAGTKQRYCGTRNPISIVSTGHDILMRLRTDSSLNFSGFNAIYSIR